MDALEFLVIGAILGFALRPPPQMQAEIEQWIADRLVWVIVSCILVGMKVADWYRREIH